MFLDIPVSSTPLPPKEWNTHLDAFLETKKLNPEILEFMDYEQQRVIKEIHKSFNRIKAKHGKRPEGESG